MDTEPSRMNANLAKLGERLQRLSGARDQAARRAEQLRADIGQAKYRLGLRESVNQALEVLETRAHQRAVGVYEKLLTALVNDVLPERRKRIRLELSTKRDHIALDIQVVREDGAAESILDGSGGSLTNVVSVGLRYIALAQTRHRPFLLLDEPDCWTRPSRVPYLINVIDRMARDMGVQTVLISHHERNVFPADTLIQELYINPDGDLDVETLQGATGLWDSDRPGIRRLRLQNFQSHRDTCLDLAPGLTVLIGDNDIGKSALTRAITALAQGESADHHIRHGADSAQVQMWIEHDQCLTLTRVRKGNPKMTYRLTDSCGNELHAGPGENRSAPDWVFDALRIAPVGGMNVQIARQSEPVFLLDLPETRRASILSVGRESSYLHAMQGLYQRWVTHDRRGTREGEAELAQLNEQLEPLATLALLYDGEWVPLSERNAALSAEDASLATLANAIDALHRCTQHVASASDALHALGPHPATPVLADTGALEQHIDRAAAAERRCAVACPASAPSAPVLQHTASLAAQITRLAALTERHRIRHLVPESPPPAPELFDVAALQRSGQAIRRLQHQIITLHAAKQARPPRPPVLQTLPDERMLARLAQARKALSETRTQLTSTEREMATAHAELERIIEQCGGQCPVCEAPLQSGAAEPPALPAHSHVPTLG